ncbi:MAG: 4Fe-4S cluster-binding domain-containing protein, partial [Eubacteriales bacterium]|nr:4Fe-4S cluster-binding domain-containing protein [Eubacteriales bacterium]
MIHQFNMHGTNIVLDVNSNAVHVLDEAADEALKIYAEQREMEAGPKKITDCRSLILDKISSKNDKAEAEEAIEELSSLEEDGLLFSPEPDIERALEFLNSEVIKSLCLNISHDCDMRCAYCFASTGNYGAERRLMDKETGFKAIDFLIAHSGGRKNLEVDFFGGEPLMNFNAVIEIIHYAKSLEDKHGKHFRFTITTNGLNLDEDNMKVINELFDNVVLSLDGDEATNDRMRRLSDGSGTYKHIMPKIKEMVKIRGDRDHYVRGTFTAHNLDFMKDALHLADEGFKSISLEPVVAPESKSYSLKENHLPAIFKEYESLAQEYLHRKQEG